MAFARSWVRSRAVAERPVVSRSMSIVPVRGSVAAWIMEDRTSPSSYFLFGTKWMVRSYLVQSHPHKSSCFPNVVGINRWR